MWVWLISPCFPGIFRGLHVRCNHFVTVREKNRGKLRKAAGTKKGKKIPVKKLQQMKRSKNPKTRKRANFALNARKWRKGGKRKN